LSLIIGQIEDQLGVVYSLNDFITFFTENTGPTYSGGGSGTGGVESVNGDFGPDVVLDIITAAERTKLSNQSGTNTGDETTGTIQSKRPLKTVGGESLEGSGNVNLATYSKIVVFDDSPLNNFNSNIFANVPGMQITIDRDGDYTFYAALNCNNDQNEEVDFTIGLTPITNRTIDTPDAGPVNVPAGTQFVSTFQVVNDTQRKKQDQTLDATFLLDNLEDGDLVDFLLNTRNDNCDLSNRRAYGYTINTND